MPYINTTFQPSEAAAQSLQDVDRHACLSSGSSTLSKAAEAKAGAQGLWNLTGAERRSRSEGCCPLWPLLLWFWLHLPLNKTVTMMQTDLSWPEINHLCSPTIPATQRGCSITSRSTQQSNCVLKSGILHSCWREWKSYVILFPFICCWLTDMWQRYIYSHLQWHVFRQWWQQYKASDLCFCGSILDYLGIQKGGMKLLP